MSIMGYRVCLACLGLVLSAGCATYPFGSAPSGAAYRAANVYRGSKQLPRSLQRVAVLPLAVAEADEAEAAAVRESLGPVLLTELARMHRFELTPVRSDLLRRWTGQSQWRSSESLPPDLFERLREETGCDAVLFSELTAFRAYPPLAIGWRLQLVSADGPDVWWAVDEVFDANEAIVADSARSYHLARTPLPRSLTDAREILNSPRRFGAYTASVVVATCPER
jgi:hypothetical protein